MSNEMPDTDAADDAALAAWLKEHGFDVCLKCGRKIGFSDLEWNDGETFGRHSTLEIQCLNCLHEIVRFHSWWPGDVNLREIVEHVLDDYRP